MRGSASSPAGYENHPDHVVYVFGDGSNKLTFPDGQSKVFDLKAGQAVWIGAGQHAAENVGKTDVHLLVIELMG